MYRTLFDLAGLAIVGWALLIFLPSWKVTRRIAESALFPAYLSVLYLVGIVTVVRASGMGFMGDFGSADGVVGLLATEPVALVAWIHILAFDQIVGVLIYRDNMKHRVLPLPLQSILLLATLMLGPIGFLAYWAARAVRRPGIVAWGERHVEAPTTASPVAAPLYGTVVAAGGPSVVLPALLRRSPALTATAALGFVLAGASAAVAAVNGAWLVGAEGRLLQAVKFDVAVGIYLLTLALVLPLAPMTERGRRRWTAWAVGLGLFSFGMENVQSWRGLDPRFSRIAGPVDQVLGGLFFLSALGLIVLFVILVRGFFRRDAVPDHPTLRLSLRYAAVAAFMGFGVGIAMSALQGRGVGVGGNLMPMHAAGFHGLQAIPLVALLLGVAPASLPRATRWVHVAGGGWLLLCLGLVVQAFAGQPPLAPTGALALSAIGAAAWAAAAGSALLDRRGAVAPALS